MAKIFGFDVHPVYQLLLRLQKARKGYPVCFVKVSEGTNYIPTGLRLFWRRVRKARFEVVGCYHFLTNVDGDKQAAHFCKRVNQIGGPKNKILIVDFEEYNGNPGKTPGNRQLGDFIRGVKKRFPGKKVMIYSGPGFWNGEDSSGDASQYNADGLWGAHYADMDRHRDPKRHWETIDTWWKRNNNWGGTPPPKMMAGQFTSTGKVANLYVDVNVFFSSMDELKEFAR